MTRDRISYGVGNKHNPSDPFGRSNLVIEPDGKARLDQDTRGGVSSFTGTVMVSALETLWKALDESGFPAVELHRPVAGAAMVQLTIGSADVSMPYHAAFKMPGYATAISLLDAIVRQLSLDTVKVGQAREKIVDGAERK